MPDNLRRSVSRRRFVAGSSAALAGSLTVPIWSNLPAAVLSGGPTPRQATGVKVGEVTDRSAIVWTRLTAEPTRNRTGLDFQGAITRKRGRPHAGRRIGARAAVSERPAAFECATA